MKYKFDDELDDSEENFQKCKGFAKLGSSKVIDSESKRVAVTNFNEKYILFNSIVHGFEPTVVFVKKDGELYDFLLRCTKSEEISDLNGKYIPVNKVSEGLYKPASVFNNYSNNYGLYNRDIIDSNHLIDICLRLGLVKFNLGSNEWELKGDKEILTIVSFIYYRKIVPSIIVSLFLVNISFGLLSIFLGLFNITFLLVIYPIFVLILYKILSISEVYIQKRDTPF